MFYQWLSTRAGSDVAFFFGLPDALEPFIDSVWAGDPLGNAPSMIDIQLDSRFAGRVTDDFTVLNHHCLLLSQAVVDLLKRAGVDSFETHPCRILGAPGPGHETPYSLIIIRDVVYGLDWDNSELELDVEDNRIIEMIYNLAVDEDRLEGNLLCRLGEDRDIILVHDSIVQAIQDVGLTGVEFAPTDGAVEQQSPIEQVGGQWPEFLVKEIGGGN